jgi:uncharacterized membrane protein YeaQ/YmgE (transglycosylase-associated protein family)
MQQELIRREMEKWIIDFLNSTLWRQIILYLTMAVIGALVLLNLQHLMGFFSQ